jgi:PAS domain S-box-containing protein
MEIKTALESAAILVVEDEIIVAHDLKIRLGKLGYSVMGMVDTGEEAVRVAAEESPDLILMDINLSDGNMEGIDAARKITEELGIPVIFLTALTDDGTIERARYARPSSYLVKPYTEIELKSNIEMAIYRAEIEKKLKESEERYRIVTSLSSDFAYSFFVDPSGRMILDWYTPAVSKITGYDGEELAKFEDVLEIVHPEDRHRVKRNLRYLTKGESFNIESRIISRDGTIRWVRIRARPSGRSDVEEGWVHAVGAVEDISELKRIEEIEKAKEQNYQAMMKKMNDGLVMVDNGGTITFVNNKLCELTGFDQFDFIGKRYSVLVEEDNKHLIEDMWGRCKSEENETFELSLRTQEGEGLPIRLSPTVLHDSRGRFSGCFAVISDISREKRRTAEILEGKDRRNRELLLVFENSHIALIEHDVTGVLEGIRAKERRVKDLRRYMLKNPGFVREMFGRLEVTYINRPALELLDAESLEEVQESSYLRAGSELQDIFRDAILLILEADRAVQLSLPVTTPSGRQLKLMANVLVSPYLEQTGRVYMSLIDFTEHEKEQERKFEAERRFRAVFQESPYAVAICSGSGKLLEVNRKFSELWGISPEEAEKLKRHSVDKLTRNWPGDTRERVASGFRGQVTVLPPFGVRRKAKDEEKLFLRGMIFPVPDETGKPKEIIFIQEDLSREEARPLFEDSREKDFEMILESIPQALIVVDENRNVLYCNGRTALLLECSSRQRILGKSILSWVAPSAGQRAIEGFNRLWEDRVPARMELPLISRSKRRFTAEINSSILTDSTKHRVLMVSLIREI